MADDLTTLTEAFAYVDRMAGGLVVHRDDAPRLVAERFGLEYAHAEGLLVLWEITHVAGGTAEERAAIALTLNLEGDPG